MIGIDKGVLLAMFKTNSPAVFASVPPINRAKIDGIVLIIEGNSQIAYSLFFNA